MLEKIKLTFIFSFFALQVTVKKMHRDVEIFTGLFHELSECKSAFDNITEYQVQNELNQLYNSSYKFLCALTDFKASFLINKTRQLNRNEMKAKIKHVTRTCHTPNRFDMMFAKHKFISYLDAAFKVLSTKRNRQRIREILKRIHGGNKKRPIKNNSTGTTSNNANETTMTTSNNRRTGTNINNRRKIMKKTTVPIIPNTTGDEFVTKKPKQHPKKVNRGGNANGPKKAIRTTRKFRTTTTTTTVAPNV